MVLGFDAIRATQNKMVSDDPKHIVSAVKKAGVIGAGGGGFPTHIKLGAHVDTVIANGSECEPLLSTDKAMMIERPDLVVEGLRLAMKATGAVKGIIAVKEHYKDVVRSLESALPKTDSIKIFLMDNYYPAGDEFLLVYEATGRIIPEGGIPLEVNVLVNNVVTLMQTAKAVHGVPVTSRAVTVTGSVASPCVVTAPIGTLYKDLVRAAGGFNVPDAVLIDGGPMMGKLVDDLEAGIAKTTSGVIALPADHFVVRMKKRTTTQEMKLSRAACSQCFRCTDLCPRNLLGHDIYPHMTMRTVNHLADEPSEHITSAFLCSQCGLCEMVSCDTMHLSPRRIYAALRLKMLAAGFKNPHRRKVTAVREPYSYRKMPLHQILKKIDIAKFDKKAALKKGELKVSKVKVPLARHTGTPASPTVKKGERVKLGDCIGEIPEGGLGARCHASIAGVITDVTNEYVEIASN